MLYSHDDIIKRKHFPPYWAFVRGIHQSLVNSPHKDQCCRALMFFFNLSLNKLLRRFEMPSCSLWHHCNGICISAQLRYHTQVHTHTHIYIWQWSKHQSSTLLALCDGNPLATSRFPSQRASNSDLAFPCYEDHHRLDLFHVVRNDLSPIAWQVKSNAQCLMKIHYWKRCLLNGAA